MIVWGVGLDLYKSIMEKDLYNLVALGPISHPYVNVLITLVSVFWLL